MSRLPSSATQRILLFASAHRSTVGRQPHYTRAQTSPPLGHATRSTYDVLNRVTTVTDALAGQTSFTYDANGNLLTLTDARNSTTSYTYDTMDRVATRNDLAGNRTAVGGTWRGRTCRGRRTSTCEAGRWPVGKTSAMPGVAWKSRRTAGSWEHRGATLAQNSLQVVATRQ